MAQLSLLAVSIRALEIEKSTGLPRFAPYLVAAWAVHSQVPKAWKPPTFLALSLGAIVLQLGFVHAAWLVAIGVGLIGIAHVPANGWVRGGLFAAAFAGLVALRVGWVEQSWVPAVMPILASMFMFRMALYVREPAVNQASWATRLSYFFMMPNALFPLFPIVDWTLWRKAPKTPLPLLHRRGVQWIVRGIAHLLLYRVVYHLFLPPPWEIVDAFSVLQWILGIYLLYLRISGQFHLIVGVLLLFDYELPETHHLYFFASSFNDYWRRVNVYWTHFVEKLIFYPAFLRLRRWNVPQPLVVAILLTFFGTWTLHAYQWFWLLGQPLLSPTDAMFWALLGSCLAANSVWETHHPKPKGAQEPSLGAMIALSAQTVAFFCTIALMWSFWFCESVEEWLSQLGLLAVNPSAFLWLLLAILLSVIAGVVLQVLTGQPNVAGWRARYDGERNVAVSLTGCLVLVGIAAVPRWEDEPAWLDVVRDATATEHLNEQDAVARTRGYYEKLQPRGGAVGGELWQAGAQRPASWKVLRDTEFVHEIGGARQYELLPDVRGQFMEADMWTSSQGLRDQEYPLRKSPRTLRIALIGSSYAMGSGISNDEVFEKLVEDRLNAEYTGGSYDHYEIINFGVAGYTTPQVVASYAEKVRPFAPDIVIITEVDLDDSRLVRQFAGAPFVMLDYPNPVVRDLAKKVWAGGPTGEVAAQRIWPLANVLTRALYEQVTAEVTADGAKMVWLFLPRTEPSDFGAGTYEQRVERARNAGMVPLSLAGAFGDLPQSELAVRPWDEHPNPRGHQLFAEALLRELVANDEALGLGLRR